MSKGVSGNTHTRGQCHHYANQHNPNNVNYGGNKSSSTQSKNTNK